MEPRSAIIVCKSAACRGRERRAEKVNVRARFGARASWHNCCGHCGELYSCPPPRDAGTQERARLERHGQTRLDLELNKFRARAS